MADDITSQQNNTAADDNDLLQQALNELEAAIRPLEDSVNLNMDLSQYYYFLYLLWGDFHIYIIEPFTGGEGSDTGAPEIIPLANGRKVFDYGFALSTSVGEDYGSYCQGKLYEAIQEMVDILAKRDVKRVSFIGNSLAMRVAWMECVANQIEIANYEPSSYDISVRNRILTLKEKAKRLKPGQELRP